MPKTLAVSLENRPGAFADVADLLGAAGVDILGFSTQALGDFGQVHLYVDRLDEAKAALEEAGTRYRMREVLVTEVPDKPGSIGRVAKLLAKGEVNIEIAFTAAGAAKGQAVLVIEVDDTARARRSLRGAGLPVLEDLRRKGRAKAPRRKPKPDTKRARRPKRSA